MSSETRIEPKKKKLENRGAKPAHVICEGGAAAMIWPRQSATGFPYYECSLRSRSVERHACPGNE